MKKSKLREIFPILVVILFIWGHSMMPHSASFRESGFIFRLFKFLFGPGFISEFLIRRSAHVIEYAVLGAMLSAFCFQKQTFWKWGWVLNLGCLVAFMDETIQIFSGRTARITDAWLDLSGVLAGALFVIALKRVTKKKNS